MIQLRPYLAQAMPPAAPALAPTAAAVPAGTRTTGETLAAAGLTLGLGTVAVLFTYGVAKETKSSLVRTTGYIMAGVGALATLLDAGSLIIGARR